MHDVAAFQPLHLREHDMPVGAVSIAVAEGLVTQGLIGHCRRGGHLVLPEEPVTEALEAIREALSAAGVIGPARNEAMPVRTTPDGQTLGTVDRSAVRVLGLWVTKVHVNGCVTMRDGTTQIWLSRRSPNAVWNPDRFDTLVAGGVAAHQDAMSAAIAECWEEAGLTVEQADTLVPLRRMAVQYVTERGWQRELLQIYDIALSEDFEPQCHDGEIAWAHRYPVPECRRLVDTVGEMKLSSALVCRDLLQRITESS